jgi:hypothetical protein
VRTALRGEPDVLMDVSALIASAQTNPVAEAFSVLDVRPATVVVGAATLAPEQTAFLAALDGPAATDAGGASATAPQPAAVTTATTSTVRVPAAQLPQLRGVTLLQQLSLLSRSQISSFATNHADVLATLAAHPPVASSVGTWWSAMPAAKRADLVSAAPGVIGNLEGVPYLVRDRANRTSLAQAEKSVRAQLRAGAGRAATAELNRRLHMLEQVHAAVASSGTSHELVGLDPSGSGTAVVVTGDVATADYVTYLVPGMFSSVDAQIDTWTTGSARIAADQQAWLDRLAAPGAAKKTVAVVTWFGYHAPDVSDVASLAPAREAETALAASVNGLRAIRGDHQPFVSVIGHSYGSTAAMLALQDDAMSVDALVVVGSPGSPATSASQLAVRGDNVWAGAAAADPVANTALVGPSPSSKGFGARTLGVSGAKDPITGKTLSGTAGHMDYFTPGSESLRNLELVTIGRGDLVLGH